MNMKKGTQKGFTLVELMIVVAIIGVIAAVAVPSYRDYVTSSRFAEATSGLANKRILMEQYFQDYRSYAPASPAPAATAAGQPCATDTSTSTVFTFSCSGIAAGTYLISATGTGSMAGFTFTIDQANNKATTPVTATGWTANTGCWIRKKGGSC